MSVATAAASPVSRRVHGWTIALGLGAITQGIWSFVWSREFYDSFPIAGAEWVSRLGPFNEHLTKDVGAALIGLGVAALAVARLRHSGAIRALAAGFVVFGALHLGFHLGELGHFGPASAAAQAVSLTLLVALPLGLIAASRTTTRS